MATVYDYDNGAPAYCPFKKGVCVTECMLMRQTGFGEPRCSIRVIADELVSIASKMPRTAKEGQ